MCIRFLESKYNRNRHTEACRKKKRTDRKLRFFTQELEHSSLVSFHKTICVKADQFMFLQSFSHRLNMRHVLANKNNVKLMAPRYPFEIFFDLLMFSIKHHNVYPCVQALQ